MVLGRRQLPPAHRLAVILAHAAAFLVEHTKVGLRLGQALIGSLGPPRRRLGVVLFYAKSP